MANFMLWVFVGINLLVRVPVRVAIRCCKIVNDKLETVDGIATLSAGVCFVIMCIAAMVEGKLSIGLGIATTFLFGGLFLFLSGAWVYAAIKDRREKQAQQQKIDLTTHKGTTQQSAPISAPQPASTGVPKHRCDAEVGVASSTHDAQNTEPSVGRNVVVTRQSSMSVEEQIATLKMLKELVDMGVLTEAEFNAKKKEILGL